jgi:hypothetical protein
MPTWHSTNSGILNSTIGNGRANRPRARLSVLPRAFQQVMAVQGLRASGALLRAM